MMENMAVCRKTWYWGRLSVFYILFWKQSEGDNLLQAAQRRLAIHTGKSLSIRRQQSSYPQWHSSSNKTTPSNPSQAVPTSIQTTWLMFKHMTFGDSFSSKPPRCLCWCVRVPACVGECPSVYVGQRSTSGAPEPNYFYVSTVGIKSMSHPMISALLLAGPILIYLCFQM